jgi:hypothetical protein
MVSGMDTSRLAVATSRMAIVVDVSSYKFRMVLAQQVRFVHRLPTLVTEAQKIMIC